ncbi:MAG: glycosyltransferase [Fimbriimonadaceae bacterium]
MGAALRALLVGNYRTDGQHSMLWFGNALAGSLSRHGVAVQAIAPRAVVRAPLPRLQKWFAYVDKYVIFPRTLRKAAREADVVHILDQGNGIYVNQLQRVSHVVTCHDLLAIRSALGELTYWQTGPLGRVYQSAILRGLRRSRFVACVSDATRRDAARLLELPAERLTTIRNGLYEHWRSCEGEPPPVGCARLTRPFVLHVGSSAPYKNRPGAIAVFAEICRQGGPSHLVLAGKPLSPAERAIVRSSCPAGSVIELAGLGHSGLEWLYGNAWALLVTSFDEGFCLPIIEAQTCGCPVFVPPKEPMTEVGGLGVKTVDPFDPVAAAKAIIEAMRGASALRTNGYKNAVEFGGDAMVAAYANLYKRLAAGEAS